MHIRVNDNKFSSHEIEVQSEIAGEVESITVDKNTGKILIRFKEDKRKKEFDEKGDYIKPLDKDKGFEIKVIGK